MPFATTTLGLVVFVVAMGLFVLQEFTQGFGTPAGGSVIDDRWAMIYLEALPVLLVTASIATSLAGWGSWPASRSIFFIGIAILAIGVAIREWSHRTLGRFHQALVTIQHDHDLVTSGPYRHVRHPMYAGSAIAFLGVALALGTWPGLILSFLGTLPAIFRRIHVEERAMAASLGGRYDDYADTRARLVPRVW